MTTQPPAAVEGEEMCPRMASMIEHGMSGINWTPTPTKLVSESERVTMTDVDRFIKATPPGEAVSGVVAGLEAAWRKLYGDGDEHGVCDSIHAAIEALTNVNLSTEEV